MAPHNIQPLLKKNYLKAVHANGVFITDEHGKTYLDGSSGAITCSLGHSYPRVLEAIRKQSSRLQFVYRSQFASEEAEALAAFLASKSVRQSHAHTFFVNSGTEAIETAMKIAQQFWQESGRPGKRRFISRWKSYHGITVGALSLSGHPIRRSRFEHGLEKYPQLHANLDTDPAEVHAKELADTLERLGPDTIAAFVAEPVVGAAGTALTPPANYYQQMRRVCDQYNILLIADEVMTGLGRTGQWFGMHHWDTVADIVAIGKSLGAGYAPIAATMMTTRLLEPIREGTGLIMSGHTYSGHPLSCGIALAVQQTIDDEGLVAQVEKQGNKLKQGLQELQKRYSVISTVRGLGLMLGVELTTAQAGLQAKLIQQCFEEGLLVYPAAGGPHGTHENGVLIAPPFVISDKELDMLLTRFQTALNKLQP